MALRLGRSDHWEEKEIGTVGQRCSDTLHGFRAGAVPLSPPLMPPYSHHCLMPPTSDMFCFLEPDRAADVRVPSYRIIIVIHRSPAASNFVVTVAAIFLQNCSIRHWYRLGGVVVNVCSVSFRRRQRRLRPTQLAPPAPPEGLA